MMFLFCSLSLCKERQRNCKIPSLRKLKSSERRLRRLTMSGWISRTWWALVMFVLDFIMHGRMLKIFEGDLEFQGSHKNQFFLAEGERWETWRGWRITAFPWKLGSLPAMAVSYSDHGGLRRHPQQSGRCREAAQPAPAAEGRDRRLRPRVCQDEGLRR